MIVAVITEAFYIRSLLAYAVGGALVGAVCYLGLIPFDPAASRPLSFLMNSGGYAG